VKTTKRTCKQVELALRQFAEQLQARGNITATDAIALARLSSSYKRLCGKGAGNIEQTKVMSLEEMMENGDPEYYSSMAEK